MAENGHKITDGLPALSRYSRVDSSHPQLGGKRSCLPPVSTPVRRLYAAANAPLAEHAE